MRLYKSDGTFVEDLNDNEFGWYLSEGPTEESTLASTSKEETVFNFKDPVKDEDKFLESVDVIDPPKPPVIINKINPKVEIQPIVSVLDCKMEIEGPPVKTDEPKLLRELKNINCTNPPKEELANLITPYSPETKALLSVIYFAKYKSQQKGETAEKLLQAVNFRTTNFKHLFNDMESNIRAEVRKEIENYHATKEDNMLSLMMELILADTDSTVEDIVDVNHPVNERTVPRSVFETSDLGNSIQSSCSSKDERSAKSHYLQMPNRSDILSSIGLSDEDKSIQSFCEETLSMHLQLAEIKESFNKEEDRIDNLSKMVVAIQKDLKETLYLNDIIHLLNGDIEKVKLKKLPFRIFHEEKNQNFELNLII